jgi:restriction system protein
LTLNDLFALDEIRIREPFEVLQDFGVAEQIDGLVSVFGNLYLVEVKWHAKPLGPDIVGQHMMRLMARSEVRGLYISKSGFTSAAISGIRDTLALRSTICADLQEILLLLDRGTSLSWWIDEKTAAAVGSKNIYWRYGVDFSDRL